MRALLFLLAMLIGSQLYAQNKGKIHGSIQSADSIALEKATVSILDPQDSSVLSYSLTDSKGKFEFVRIPQHKNLLLYISHINARTFHKTFNIGSSGEINFGTLRLENNSLDEIVVTARPPIRMNKDTLEYNTDYFKTRPNANVEELLKELPGLQVNMDGTIYYEGKEVSSIRVDDKEFFNTDLKIASRNLDASMVQTVQVFKDKGFSKKEVANEEDLPIIINLKFKKKLLKSNFGKLYASGGTNEHYESGVLLNSFRDTTQISLIGFSNNINRRSFEYSELYEFGGLSRGENQGFMNFGGRNYQGVGQNTGIGINVNNDWSKNTKLNVMYMFNRDKSILEQVSQSERLFENNAQWAGYNAHMLTKSTKHDISSLFRHKFDTLSHIEFRPSISFVNKTNENNYHNESLSDDQKLLNERNAEDYSPEEQLNYSHNLRYERQFGKKHIISFNYNHQINNGLTQKDNNTETYLVTRDNPNWTFSTNDQTQTKSHTYAFSPSYQNKMFEKLTFDTYIKYERLHYTRDQEFWLQNDTLVNTRWTDIENRYHFSANEYVGSIKVYWKPTKELSINMGTAYQIYENTLHYDNVIQDRTTTYRNWLPNIYLYYKNLTIGWQRNFSPPSYSQLQTRINNIDELSIRMPFYDIQNAFRDTYEVSYRKYGKKHQFSMNASLDYQDKSLGYYIFTNTENGAATTKSYLSPEQINTNIYAQYLLNINISKDWKLRYRISPHTYSYQHYMVINDVENKNTSYHSTLNTEFTLTWKDLVGISPQYTYSIQTNKNSVKNDPNFLERSFIVHTFGTGLSIHPIKGFSLESTYKLSNQANGMDSRRNIHLLDASVYYNLKTGSQIKLTGFDMLNQNIQSYWGAQGNGTYYYQANTLNQYFLLGYIHKFNFTKTKP